MDWLVFGAIAAASLGVEALGAYVMMRERVLYHPLARDELVEGNRAGVGLIWLRQRGSVRLLCPLVIRLRFRSKEP